MRIQMPTSKAKKLTILAALATIASLLCYDVQVTGGLFRALNSRALSMYLGNGTCEYIPAIQWTDTGFPSDTNFTKTIIAGYPSGDKRMFYLQLEGLTGLSARDEWEFKYIAHTNQPFIKANYPHHEGIWGWGDVGDQVVLVVSDLRKVMIEYHDILWDIGYAQTFEEAYERIDNLYKETQEGVEIQHAPAEDFLVWRDLRLFDEVHWYSWFIDYYMEGGLMRDMFNHEKTVPAQWHMSILPNFFTKFEVRHGRFVNESEPIEDSYDPMCSTLSKGCYPVLIVDPAKLIDTQYGPIEARKIAEVVNGTEGFADWMIEEDAWECIWNELIVNRKGLKTFLDRDMDYESFAYSFEIKNEMWHELTRLIEKYEVIQDDQVAIDLVNILTGHREELGITEPADPLTYEELMSYHLAFPPFFPNQKMFQSDDDFYVNVHEEYGNYDTSYETIIERRRKFFEIEMEKKRQRKVTVNYYDATGWTSLPAAGLSSLTPYATDTTYKINYPDNGGTFASSGRADNVAALFQGYLYTDPLIKKVCITSDDGSKLYLNDVLVINNDGLHNPIRKCTDVTTAVFKLDVEYFERDGGAHLVLEFGPSTDELRAVPPRSWASADSQRRYRELLRLNDLILEDVKNLKETDIMGPATRAAFNMKKKAEEGKAAGPTISREDRRLVKEALHNFDDFDEIQKLPKTEQLKVMRNVFGG